MTANSRVLALTSTRELFGDALHGGLEERFQLGARLPVHLEIAPEGIAHLGVVALATGVLAQHEYVSRAAQLVHPRPVVSRHGEDQVGALDQLAREKARPVPRQIEAALEAHEVGAFGRGRAVPGPSAGGRDG